MCNLADVATGAGARARSSRVWRPLAAHQYFQPGTYSLFPIWPQYRDGEIATLLSMTIALLMLPKLLGALLALRERRLRQAFGGGIKLVCGVALEQLMSMLLAPTMMLFHSSFVVRSLLGRNVGWEAQARGDRGVSWGEALKRHAWHVGLGLGVVWGGAMLALAPAFMGWMLPVIAGMLISVPFTVLTSRSRSGAVAAGARLAAHAGGDRAAARAGDTR